MSTDKQDPKRALVAARLREARKLAGISQGQVAKPLGVHRPSITEIEAGNRRVSAGELSKPARRYDVTVSWLLAATVDTFERSEPQFGRAQISTTGTYAHIARLHLPEEK